MRADAEPIPRFDPRSPRNALYRTITAFIRTPVGRRFGITVASRFDPLLMRLTRGRLASGLVFPIALLTTVGARSGKARQVAILYFTDGDDVILIASNWGGAHNPAWYHNLRANPASILERGGRLAHYTAEEVRDEGERQHLFALADLVYAGYADYRAMTSASGRQIPVMRLRRCS